MGSLASCCANSGFVLGKRRGVRMNDKTKKLYYTAEFKAMGDMTNNGLMNIDEFCRLMMLLGFPGGLDNGQRLWDSAKEHGAYMNLQEYITLMANPSIDSKTNMWRMLFAEFDTDGSGFASPDEVKEGLEKIGVTVGPDLNEKLHRMDNNKDGKINYSDFLKMQLNQKNS